MIGQQVWLHTPEYSSVGAVELILDARQDLSEVSRRVSRVATLDGGVAIYDSGYSSGDREFSVDAELDQDAADTVLGWVQTQPILHLMSRAGAFAVVPRRARYVSGKLRIVLWVQSDLIND